MMRILSLFLFMLVGLFVAGLFLAVYTHIPGIADNARATIYGSAILQSVLAFVFPAILALRMSGKKPLSYLKLKGDPQMGRKMALAISAFILSYACVSFINQWNQGISLPSALSGVEQWMRSLEDQAMDTTKLLLSGNRPLHLLLNLLVVAGVAAFSEEIFFRGALQQFLQEKYRNGHAAVWISALIFSLVHLQFYGFFPRLVLGALLGYLFLYTRNLWAPILAHFINNATVIVLHYFWGESEWVEALEGVELTVPFATIALISAGFTILLFRNYRMRESRASR